MAENVSCRMPTQGDRFEDQYTSATADLSAGGVATAIGAMEGQAAGNAPSTGSSHRWAPSGGDYSSPLPTQTDSHAMVPSGTIGMGAGALLSIGGAIGGAWLYARRPRERNNPI